MSCKFLISNFYITSWLDTYRISSKIYYKLINPNSEVIAGSVALGLNILDPRDAVEWGDYKFEETLNLL